MPMKLANETQRRGNPAVLAVCVVAALLVTTVHAREGEGGPLHALRSATLSAAAPVARAGGIVTTPFRWVGGALSGLGISRTELAALRKQNADLREQLKAFAEAKRENERLKALVKFVDTAELASVGAHVIGRPSNSWEGALTIDRGTADGVRVGMPVLSEHGLVGQVVTVSKRSAVVRLVTDQESGVAVLIQATRASGIVRGTVQRGMMLDFYEGKALPRSGDVLITSGMGGVYPKGLVVGDVAAVDVGRDPLHPRVEVRSRVDLQGIEEVLVLVGAPPKADLGSGE